MAKKILPLNEDSEMGLEEPWEVIGYENCEKGKSGVVYYGLKEELIKEFIPNSTKRLIVEIGIESEDVRGKLVRVYYKHNNPMISKYADTRLLCYMENPRKDLNDLLCKYWIVT